MGITITIKNKGKIESFSIGYGGFLFLRNEIRKNCLIDGKECVIIKDDEQNILSSLNENVSKLIANKLYYFQQDKKDERCNAVFNFLTSSDCGGTLSNKNCKIIFLLLKNSDFLSNKYSKTEYQSQEIIPELEFYRFLEIANNSRSVIKWS